MSCAGRSKIAQNRDRERSQHFVTDYWENLVFGLTEQRKKLEKK